MESFLTVAVILAVIVLWACVIQLINRRHEDRLPASHRGKLPPAGHDRKTTPPQ